MANTFKKVYRKVANTGAASDYTLVAEVGANGVTLERMTGATSAANGKMGLVPAPTSGNQNKFLRGDATWTTPENTTYGIATTTSAGLAPALGGGTSNFLRADGTWAAPTANVTSTDTITENSTALITSGGVYAKLGLNENEPFMIGDESYNSVKSALTGIDERGSDLDPYHTFYFYCPYPSDSDRSSSNLNTYTNYEAYYVGKNKFIATDRGSIRPFGIPVKVIIRASARVWSTTTAGAGMLKVYGFGEIRPYPDGNYSGNSPLRGMTISEIDSMSTYGSLVGPSTEATFAQTTFGYRLRPKANAYFCMPENYHFAHSFSWSRQTTETQFSHISFISQWFYET